MILDTVVSKKRPLPQTERCIQCDDEAKYSDDKLFLSFCSDKCQEKYHLFDVTQVHRRAWSKKKLRVLTDHLFLSSWMTKYRFLCEWLCVADIRMYIMSMVIGNMAQVFLYPKLVDVCDRTTYIIGGKGLYAMGNSVSVHDGAIRVVADRSRPANTFVVTTDDNGDSEIFAHRDSIAGTSTYFPMHFSNDVVDIAARSQKMIIKYNERENASTLWGCGNNRSGKMGFGDDLLDHVADFHQVPTQFGNPLLIACGTEHTALVTTDGTLYMTGTNFRNSLGMPLIREGIKRFTRVEIDTPCIISLACGDTDTFFVTIEGHLYVCGDNRYGHLGTLRSTDTFERVPGLPSVCQVSTGFRFTMVVANDGTLWASGMNNYGQHGTGYTHSSSKFICIPLIKDVVSVVCGENVTLITLKDGTHWAAGSNFNNKLGLGVGIPNVHRFTRLSYLPKLTPLYKEARMDQK